LETGTVIPWAWSRTICSVIEGVAIYFEDLMYLNLIKRTFCFLVVTTFALVGTDFSQDTDSSAQNRNFSHSPNPRKRKAETKSGIDKTSATTTIDTNTSSIPSETKTPPSDSTSASSEISVGATSRSPIPTEIYRVGIGDVLLIGIQDSPGKDAGYFTVLKDGTIDFPLAGQLIAVSGLTVSEIEDVISGLIKVVENPRISVRVREYNSHSYKVLGLVERPGEKYLQREAIPLYVVRAEAIAQPKATKALIRRGSSQIESIDLVNQKYEEIFVYPGDIVEFVQGENNANTDSGREQYIYISGNVVTGGQKLFHSGLTLTQAIFAARGLTRPTVRKVVVRRRNSKGLLDSQFYDLKEILDGRSADPILQAGDTIEVGN